MASTHASCIVRSATLSDVPALASVHLRAWLATYRGIIADAYLDALDQKTFEGYHRPRFDPEGKLLAGQPFVVACDAAGEVIGFARGGPMREKSPTGDPLPEPILGRFSAELFAIYLLPEHLGRGVGFAMFRETMHQLMQLGHNSMCVWVLNDNPLGRRFYQRLGGELIDCQSHITLGGIAYPHLPYAWPDLRAIK